MKVRRFEARKVHGYLHFDISFHPDITYLTGINGSGKTTVVNSISALISPSLGFLAETEYESMQVTLDLDDSLLTITSSKQEGVLLITSSDEGAADPLRIAMLDTPELLPSRRVVDRDAEYYREQEARYASHPVMKRLKDLPTPMFLGLERRSSTFFPADAQLLGHSLRHRSHNVFAGSFSRSLVEAASLAEQSHSNVQARQRELTDALKKEFILSALQYSPPGFAQADFPSLDPANIARVRNTLRELGLSGKQIEEHLDPFVDRLRELSAYLPFADDLNEILQGDNVAKRNAYMEWWTNGPQFHRLTRLLGLVDRYVAASQKASRPLDVYLETVNNFLVDSKKRLRFDRTGKLIVGLPDKHTRPITALSSGESQIVVMLTHLAFNPAARADNVFIVDEPELSLHLRWQELFVEAIKTLNPRLQTILATHSPAIILEDIDNCIDLSSVRQA